ncbi:MAG: three-Cys-motif partner protein TcmP [Gammaproteobacteria bacterium]|nr:three-Cys-motif partner protein TcmP [Gammaproteobacteria bacterium]
MIAMSDYYSGREQAYIKHTILKSYLQRLFMIVGRSKADVINYVDCFAGPWLSGDDDLADTSIGISLKQLSECRASLLKNFNRDVKFRALYIERNPESFRKLQKFLAMRPDDGIETTALAGDYTVLTEEITKWCGRHFTFFFIDPMGFKDVIGARTLQRLLQKQDSEFLINFMYDFINRFIEVEKHRQDWEELLGEVPALTGLDSEQRQEVLLQTYRNSLNQFYQGRTVHVSIQKPGKDRPLYFLVYLTRNARGIEVFKQEAEKMEIVQRNVQREYKLKERSERTQTLDMFAETLGDSSTTRIFDNKASAKEYLLNKLSRHPLKITVDVWADMLQETNFFPSDIHAAMKELFREGHVENMDADISRRKTNIIKPGYAGKSERWRLTNKR